MPWIMDAGDGRRTRQYRLAVHEAGHAVMALHLGQRVHSVSIVQDLRRSDQGHALIDHDGDVSTAILIALAGPVAEILAGGGSGPRWERDLAMASEWACQVCSTEAGVDEMIDRMWARAQEILGDARLWASVEALALVLMERREIDGREAGRICRQAAAIVEEEMAGGAMGRRGWA